MPKRVAIIGAGASGCFCAIELKRRCPQAEIIIFEAGRHPLAKVSVTGGGRCNLTNSFDGISSIKEAYPRGSNLMKKVLQRFSNRDVMQWFEDEGVRLTVQDDCCVFPVSQNAMEIVDCLLRLNSRLGVNILTGRRVELIRHGKECYTVSSEGGSESFDAVIVCSGGSPKESGLRFLSPLGLEMEKPVPSLFTFRIEDKSLKSLMGTVMEEASLSIPGTSFKAGGPILITDWGLSGPAILKLSSHAARYLSEHDYRSELVINWLSLNEQEARELLFFLSQSRKLVLNERPDKLPSRLWSHLVIRSGVKAEAHWQEVGSKSLNRLVNSLVNDNYSISGRASFKEEFVTCGGVSLNEIDQSRLESKKHPGLFFAGEVLDIDAVTGGFNLQAAWSTGMICAGSAASFLSISD